jgi:anti-anti-sigma factor
LSQFEPAPFRVTRVDSDGDVRLELCGELDMSSAPELDTTVIELRPITAPLVLDVGGLTFVDSAGLRSLLTARRAAMEDVGEPVVLVDCPDALRKLLAISGLTDAFAGDTT